MRIAQMGHTDIKTTKQFYEFDRETNAEKAQKLGEIEELRLLFEDIFFVPPTVLENLPFRGAVPCGTRKFSPPGLKETAFSGGSPAQHKKSQPPGLKETAFSGGRARHKKFQPPRIEKSCLFGGQSALKQASAQRHILPETSVSATTHPPRNKRQRSGTSPRNKRQRSGPPGNKCRHNGTFCPEQHPSVIDTPDVHRPAARYSLGDMPYLRRKRRMK